MLTAMDSAFALSACDTIGISHVWTQPYSFSSSGNVMHLRRLQPHGPLDFAGPLPLVLLPRACPVDVTYRCPNASAE